MDATSLLGSMIGSNFGRGRGPSLNTVVLGATGLAAAGGLGYLAYRHFQGQNPAGAPMQGAPMQGAPTAAPGGGFLAGVVGSTSGLRTDGFSVPGYEWQTGGGTMPGGPPPAAPAPVTSPPAPTPQQQNQALLLVRAMVAAANADGVIDDRERADILARLDAAGVGPSEREVFVRELDSPKPITLLTREVSSPELAEQFYVVSVLAAGNESEAEKAHLRMLPSLLNLSPADVDAIHKKTGLPVVA